ncbi:hypothetical protein GGX14DRAFT_463047 [Mycena pura]|uniref:Uncharacterized protein n=1 Tax=Mycena pura TaxID=153505 RepID=A0AAD6Y5K6_9AGAR|nr:hypothetical protein GGX14DRAFT_463047 [Mycena pura]
MICTLRPRALPGGEPLPIRLNVKDRMEPQITTLSWPHESEPHCTPSPLKAGARDSDAPSTPRAARATNVPRRLYATERCGSTLSDDTDTDFFHRPAANPHVSPTQLPPLCDAEDSDDEFFVATQADDAEESSDGSNDVVLARGGYEPSPEARALFGLDYASDDEVSGDSYSKTETWLAAVSPEPSSPAAQATYQFEFILPADAPVFPRAEAPEVSSSPVRARPLAPSVAANRPLYHPRPSDDDLFE